MLVDDRRADVGHLAALGQSVDDDGEVHPGLFEKGLPVLGAERHTLPELRARALAAGVGVIDIPAVGQQTNDYDAVRAHVERTATADLEYLGLALHRPAPCRQPRDRDLAAVGPIVTVRVARRVNVFRPASQA